MQAGRSNGRPHHDVNFLQGESAMHWQHAAASAVTTACPSASPRWWVHPSQQTAGRPQTAASAPGCPVAWAWKPTHRCLPVPQRARASHTPWPVSLLPPPWAELQPEGWCLPPVPPLLPLPGWAVHRP